MDATRRPRSTPLRRGKACLVCRHLKIKCDGVRPRCGPCVLNPKEEACHYNEANSRTQELEETVARLRLRVAELERSSTLSASPPGSPSTSPSPSSPDSFSSRRSTPNVGTQEPPLPTIQTLLDAFLPHAAQVGFFLHVDNFRASALLPFPMGDVRRPSPALLRVVYLWGLHLSQTPSLLSPETTLLQLAQQALSTEISDRSGLPHALHTIQAQVLLSNYLLRNKQFLEAEYHANGAATLAMAYQLHRVCSSRVDASSSTTETDRDLGWPISPVDEGERIRCFWTVVCLQSSFAFVVGNIATTSLSILESSSNEIDTPWPEDFAEYESRLAPSPCVSQETIKTFLVGDPQPVYSLSALQAQAMVLLHRALRLGSKWTPALALQPDAFASFVSSVTWLEGRMEFFWGSLPPEASTSPLICCTIAAATLALHQRMSESSPNAAASAARCLWAARLIISSASSDSRPSVACPLFGSLCTLAADAILNSLREARHFHDSFMIGLGLDSPVSDEETVLLGDMQGALQTMESYAPGNPLLQHQLGKVRRKYETIE
uniref:Zn(2)-C6 fungal-type domain-containing protein n=1 Tax=Mycena chlorophos TaxID=658473 RepID=A0ABQ0LR85_MYCCL|nr:predicted protein [Mycena chlorophos]